ncbi:MAG: methylated-DNA-[protein]-cysteine S-methyltransferase [Solirubrobacteraceae bacterium]|jgi:methylated-DNA-[protein]-cysteine S-methyltransferase|nr:methylated-DNA-[protein]-cysteine S-methyltransferase [Solirubrobacteraceae bacterium]
MTDRLAPPTFDPADAAAAAARFAATAPADVTYARVDSPIGTLVAATTPRGLACLSYEDHDGGLDAVLDRLATKLSPRILEAPARLDDVRRELDEYFERRRTTFDLPIDWALVSPFGRRVLRATAAIPFGEVSTYAQVAAEAGNAKASRAAGNALGANPMPIVLPCHRVLHTGGKGIGNYTGGVHRKEALLRLEGVLLGG